MCETGNCSVREEKVKQFLWNMSWMEKGENSTDMFYHFSSQEGTLRNDE